MLRERSLAQSGPPLLCCEKCKKKSPKRFTLAGKNVIVYVMAMSSAQTEDGERRETGEETVWSLCLSGRTMR